MFFPEIDVGLTERVGVDFVSHRSALVDGDFDFEGEPELSDFGDGLVRRAKGQLGRLQGFLQDDANPPLLIFCGAQPTRANEAVKGVAPGPPAVLGTTGQLPSDSSQ